MKLAASSMIPEIDAYLASKLNIPTSRLMQKSGEAIADAVRRYTASGKSVVILAGKGNNGGDGYAAACELIREYSVKVVDVFSAGQKSEEGRVFLEKYKSLGGETVPYDGTAAMLSEIKGSDCIVDAIFGTGFLGEMPEFLRPLAITVREAVTARKISVDVPLGINPDDGSISSFAISVSATVALSYIKPGILSYPARSHVGEIIYADLGIPKSELESVFSFNYNMIDSDWVRDNLPIREENSNKGTFGKLLVITGSEKYRGAAHLSCEAALRGGVGMVTFLGCEELVGELSAKYPEIIFKKKSISDELTDDDIREIVALSASHGATLIGCGSDNTDGLLRLTRALIEEEGTPLILDADAINALSGIGEEGMHLFKRAKREVIITPHPLEFARVSLSDVASVQLHRLSAAKKFAAENKITVVLKGAGSIITDGSTVYINTSGSSALAKAGSGDVLAGFLAAIVAQGKNTPTVASALAVYLHAVAGQRLAGELSAYGVTPSDLPKEIARVMGSILSGKADEFDV